MWKSLTESRPSSRDELAAWYEAVLFEQESGGLSVAEAAEEVGVTPATLYHWRRRLSGESRELGADSRESRGLIELSVVEKRSEAEADSFIVRIDGGRSIEVPHDFNESMLKRLVAVLEEC